MRIDKTEKGEFGNFQIHETEGREIIDKFIDIETQLIIVREKYRDLNAWGGYSYDYVTINPNNGDIIEIDERKNFINYDEQLGEDLNANITYKTRRIHGINGNETIEIEIFHPDKNESLKSSFHFAFSKEPHKPIAELYDYLIKSREENRIQKEKALKEYLSKSYEDRVKYWSGNLHQQMRWNAESGFDEYAVFSKDWLDEIKKYEPRIKEILDDVIKNYWKNYWNADKIKEALKK